MQKTHAETVCGNLALECRVIKYLPELIRVAREVPFPSSKFECSRSRLFRFEVRR